MSTEYDESDCEEMQEDSNIPDQEMDVKRQEISLGKLFERKKDGTPKLFDPTEDRDCKDSVLLYRMSQQQRWGSKNWKLYEKQRLIDSIFKGYPMSGITLSHHIRIINDKPLTQYDFEDFGSRGDIIYNYYNDGFKYKEKLFSELLPEHKSRFEQYTVSVDTISEASPESICEAFHRLNCGKPLKDEDRYYALTKTSPLVQLAIKVMKSSFWDAKTMKTDSFCDKKRGILPEVCALVATLVFVTDENGPSYTSVSSARLSDLFHTPINEKKAMETIHDFCCHYGRIIQRAEGIDKTHNYQMKWHKTSGQLGLIMHDYLDKTSPHTLKQKEDMWVEIMQIARTVPDFMYGKQTIWNGLSKGARQSNSEKKTINEKIARIRKFYDPLTRKDLCLLEGIIHE